MTSFCGTPSLSFRMWDRVAGLFMPAVSQSEDQRARTQLLIVACLCGMLAAGAGALALFSLGAAELAAITAIPLGACALTLVVLRTTSSLKGAIQVLATSVSLGHGLAAVGSGDPTLLGSVAVVPLVVMLLMSDLKWAGRWFLLNLGTIIGVSLLFVHEPSRIHLAAPAVLLVRLLLFLLSLFGLTIFSVLGQQRTQRSLEEARDEANRANALKSEFLASFSHEIRTPLNGVLGTADALLAGPLPSEVREQLLVIQRSGSSLLRTINDVLELSRIEAGRLDLFPVATDLPALLGEVVELFRARANSSGLTLSLELRAGHPRHVTVDDLRLRQVVQNLVGNAVKFTRSGEVRVRLAEGLVAEGQVLTRISVEDTGPGIDPAALGRLFSAFTQARPKTDRTEGAGLGLAISKQFIELMEGKLSVDSQLGKGSSFTIELTLPVAESAASPAPAPVQLAPAHRLKLLVVDDNEINLKVATALLSRLGHELVVARDGEQALAAVTQHQPDVVFMDCHMPGVDGLEATRRLRAAGDGRPVVALTASVYAEDQRRCREAGMNHFVSKPVTLLSLQAAIREVTGARPPRASVKPAVEPQGRVLVVDDDPHVRRMTVRMLRAEGFEVSDAGDVESALILFERAEPSFLLVDQVLGGSEDGLRFAARLSQRRQGLRVVVTSGRSLSEEQLAALEAAGGRFLAKPYSRKLLMACLRERLAA
jgi:signal transduction histidine kinase/CheY-like chemotaxis protein